MAAASRLTRSDQTVNSLLIIRFMMPFAPVSENFSLLFAGVLKILSRPILSASQDSGSDDYAMVGYKLANSLSKYGAVCRAVCECDKKMFLKGIVERTKIEKQERQIFYINQAGEKQFMIGDEIVSMNFWGFGQSVFEHLQSQFGDFLANFGSDIEVEFFLPTAIGNLIEEKKVRVKVLPTDQSCFGVTYRKDNASAAAKLNKLIEQGVYPKKLWE